MRNRKLKALIVEDEAIAALGLEALVAAWGYEVCESAANGKDAIRKASMCKPDIILMDVNLAGKVDGIEAAKEIRSERQVPIIFISGYADEMTKEKAGITGAVEYFQKPLDYDELEKKMKDLLEKKEGKLI